MFKYVVIGYAAAIVVYAAFRLFVKKDPPQKLKRLILPAIIVIVMFCIYLFCKEN